MDEVSQTLYHESSRQRKLSPGNTFVYKNHARLVRRTKIKIRAAMMIKVDKVENQTMMRC
jgi:phage gp45-like